MIEISKPVLNFLSNLTKERAAIEAGESSDRTLQLAIESAEAKGTEQLEPSTTFVSPELILPPKGQRMSRIQYWKPADDIAKAKRLLKVTTFTAVGEKTFDYFMDYEGGE